MIDLDGVAKYSNSTIVKRTIQDDLKVYPIPFTNSIFVQLNNELKGDISITMRNLLGEVVYKNAFIQTSNQSPIEINNLDKIHSGFYCLEIQNAETGKAKLIKVIKQ